MYRELKSNLKKRSLTRFLILIVAFTFLSGCTVVETYSRFTDKKDPEKSIEYHVKAAFLHLQHGHTEPAKQKLNEVLNERPNHPAALAGMALALEREGEPEDAESYYRRSIKADPGYTRGKELFGAFLFSRGRYQEALNQFEEVTRDKLYENLAVANLNLGLCAIRLGQKELARESFEKSVTINSKQTKPYIQLAKLSYEEQDYRFASRYYRVYEKNLGAVQNYTPASLMLGYRIEKGAKRDDIANRYILLLAKLYPNSSEYAAYLKTQSKTNDVSTTVKGKES
ncbi:type IV pilus biogenesis/stability protein PilW [Litoribacillus peritrichatus]|uniref:Type IV pilus biogenesis/stability protein PilW n=1 Tax=Litoribacillus peritrichatus TaxID=718191 RepID=A0ABP7M0F2_9GAMM